MNKNSLKNEAIYGVKKSNDKSPNIINKFSFATNHNGQQSPVYPKTPTGGTGYGQNFSSFIKGNNSSFELKSGLRTKTTEFFTRGKDIKKMETSIQNKSFTQN